VGFSAYLRWLGTSWGWSSNSIPSRGTRGGDRIDLIARSYHYFGFEIFGFRHTECTHYSSVPSMICRPIWQQITTNICTESNERRFADTFYFLAMVNRKDQGHQKCVAFSQASAQPVVTTTWILLEVGDALRQRRDRAVFSALLKNIDDDPDTTVVPADQSAFDKALELFHSRPDKEWSLTDCTSFITMQQNGLTEALTADHHFEQAGFAAIFASRS
jgi:predicted nucleic acid-binding protein